MNSCASQHESQWLDSPAGPWWSPEVSPDGKVRWRPPTDEEILLVEQASWSRLREPTHDEVQAVAKSLAWREPQPASVPSRTMCRAPLQTHKAPRQRRRSKVARRAAEASGGDSDPDGEPDGEDDVSRRFILELEGGGERELVHVLRLLLRRLGRDFGVRCRTITPIGGGSLS